MQSHAQRDGTNQVHVLPQRQPEQTFVLGKRVHGVEHFNGNENRETHCCRTARHLIGEHIASNLRELGSALMEMGLQVIKC